MELVSLQVKIGLKNDNSHAYPPFNEIHSSLRDDLDWSHFIDKFGGWHYDQVAGHVDDDIDSPSGTWIGMLLVPESFADAAVLRFPEQCSILIETDAETFYNNRAHVREPEIFEDAQTLQAIKIKRDMDIPESQDDLDALNPDHPKIGRRRNKNKTFIDYKTNRGVSIKS